MTTLASSIGTSQAYIPVVNASQLGKLVGVPKYFSTISALNAAVSAENTNIANGSALWADGEPLAVVKGATYTWNASAGVAAVVASAVTGVTYDTATPPRVTGYTQDGITYTLTYGANGLATKVGGGHTTTANYNSSGQLTGTTVS